MPRLGFYAQTLIVINISAEVIGLLIRDTVIDNQCQKFCAKSLPELMVTLHIATTSCVLDTFGKICKMVW